MSLNTLPQRLRIQIMNQQYTLVTLNVPPHWPKTGYETLSTPLRPQHGKTRRHHGKDRRRNQTLMLERVLPSTPVAVEPT
jgi:hypothetical protein